MKKLLTLIICLLSLQLAKASPAPGDGKTFASVKNSTQNTKDTTFAHAANQVFISHGTITERRLDSIQKDVPLDYNEYVQNYIDLYTANRDEMAHVIGLSKYYFPIYEKVFRDAGIPAEIEYLSIVESKLDPNAVSRVGATGPWQFMGTTAKLYGLNMDDYVDERRDPVRASYAAAAYLKDAYQEFGDWLLAIASYNCGKSNVENAMVKAGANDFWSIRQYLPLETRNYVPAYIAVAYVMNYYKKHNIHAETCGLSCSVDTVKVDRYLSLGSVANVINVDVRTLAILNPAYKLQAIYGTPSNPRKLIIPPIDKARFANLYAMLNGAPVTAPVIAQVQKVAYVAPVGQEVKTTGALPVPASHIIQKGETLGDIADTYGITLQDLKTWNHLNSNRAVVGQKIKLSAEVDAGSAQTPLSANSSSL